MEDNTVRFTKSEMTIAVQLYRSVQSVQMLLANAFQYYA